MRRNDNLLAISDKPYESDVKVGSLEAEVRLLKEALAQERQKRDNFFQDIANQYQDLYGYVHRNESSMLNKLRKHQEDVIEENKRTKDQQRKLEE